MGAQAWVAVFILAVAGVIPGDVVGHVIAELDNVHGHRHCRAGRHGHSAAGALALNPAQTIIMIALQATGLATITPFMQALNLVMIAATL
jgi:hypothetical protein